MSRPELLRDVERLAHIAADHGDSLLENGLLLILQAAKLPLEQKRLLASAGQQILSAVVKGGASWSA